MASGKFSSMNKVRPGAYINFETQSVEEVNIGTRGIATMALPLSWGEEGSLIELSGNDMISGKSLSKVGLIASDADALLINLALQNCRVLKIYNTNSGGVAATKVLGENGITVTAKHPGTFGNKIAIVIKAADTNFIVETYANGYFIESQKVSAVSELKANDFVTFGTTGTLAAISSTLLAGGTDGTTQTFTNYSTNYFNALRVTKWNTMACNLNTEGDIGTVVDFIKEMREDEGKYVQVVVANYDTADHEGIINLVNGVVLEDGTTISAADFTAWVAGATAGAQPTESLTGKVVEGAVSIVNPLSNSAIETGLVSGQFILSLNQSGQVKVEKDINSLHTFTADKGYVFSKNRVIREIDEIGFGIEDIWETTYLGKVSNTKDGRTLFKSSIIKYLSDFAGKGGIEEFDNSSVVVEQGDDIDSVVASLSIRPLDSMEFLYMTVNVQQ